MGRGSNNARSNMPWQQINAVFSVDKEKVRLSMTELWVVIMCNLVVVIVVAVMCDLVTTAAAVGCCNCSDVKFDDVEYGKLFRI
jgi:predicted dithiol-disulfide oxidoreductase (DUF899 family)